jgi:ABC-2 type transport system permease protein
MSGTDPTPGDVIHDIGFRHYDGPRLGRGWVVRSLILETVRGIFGLGRPARSKVMPWILIAILLMPPLVIALSVLLIGGNELPLSYTQYLSAMGLVISLFVAGSAPYCVSRDLRYGVMPLYLSRPMQRTDYVLAKVAGLTIAMFTVLATTETLLLVGALLAKLPVGAQLAGWAGGLFAAALLALLLAVISLVIAALTPRRGLGVAAIITTLLVVSGVTDLLTLVAQNKGYTTLATYLPALDPFALVDGVVAQLLGIESANDAVYPGDATGLLVYGALAVVVIGGAMAILVRRYQKVGAV